MSERGEEIRVKRLQRISILEKSEELNFSVAMMCELGQLYYAENRVQEALNQFYKVLKMDESNSIARSYIQIIRGVLDFVNRVLLNP
ncbi:MAG: hypothetical protein J6K74_00735 [Marinifilaceae bacterium]|nr:hypothetical protein [Marinifilaceae bacterium]